MNKMCIKKIQIKQVNILTVVILILSVLILFYSMYVIDDVVTRDQWRFLSVIQDYKSGNFTINDLWETHSQQRTPLYKAWFLINANLFGLNTNIDIYIGAVSLFILVFIVIRDTGFSHTWLSNKYTFLSVIALILTAFSLNQWSQLTYGLNAFQDLFGTLCLVAMFFHIRKTLDLDFTTNRAIYTFLILMSYSLLIGEVRTPAAAVAIVGACIVVLIERSARRTDIYKYLAVIVITIIFSQAIYWFVPPATTSLSKGSMPQDLFVQIFNAISYLLVLLANGIIPAAIVKGKLSLFVIQFIGGVALLLMMSVVYLGLKRKIYKHNPVPLMMIIFSLAYGMELLVGRFNLGFGLNNAMAPRYVNETVIGYIGIVWSAGLMLSKQNTSKLTVQTVNLLLVLVIFSMMQLFSSLIVVNYAKYQRKANERYLAQVKAYAGKKEGERKDLPKWACNNQNLCANGINFLKQNSLNYFRYVSSH